jgi:hypothetical protein
MLLNRKKPGNGKTKSKTESKATFDKRHESPPPIHPNLRSTIRRRYDFNQQVADTFLMSTGHDQFLNANTATNATTYVESWRIKTIEMWATPSLADNTGECSITQLALQSDNLMNDPISKISDSTNQRDKTAHILIHADESKPFGGWHQCSTVNPNLALFGYSGSNGCIMDIVYEVIFPMGVSRANYSTSSTGMVPGNLYTKVLVTNVVPVEMNITN